MRRVGYDAAGILIMVNRTLTESVGDCGRNGLETGMRPYPFFNPCVPSDVRRLSKRGSDSCA
jgi:hypothetical protein